MPSIRAPARPRATRKLAPRSSNVQSSSTANVHNKKVENDDERLERERRESQRKERKRRRRLDALERGTATIDIDSLDVALPSESTYAGTLAGILAGRRAMESDEGMVDVEDLGHVEGASRAEASVKRDGASAPTKSTRRTTTAPSVKALISSRKGYNALIETASSDPLLKAPFTYLTAAAPPSRYPDHRGAGRVCQICGTDWVRVKCVRCAEGTCGIKCSATHDETRCDQPM